MSKPSKKYPTHCLFCARIQWRTAESYRENPFCSICLHDRIRRSLQMHGPTCGQREYLGRGMTARCHKMAEFWCENRFMCKDHVEARVWHGIPPPEAEAVPLGEFHPVDEHPKRASLEWQWYEINATWQTFPVEERIRDIAARRASWAPHWGWAE